jgi:hypothetical protein
VKSNWFLAAAAAVVSGGLGITINLATELKTSPLAWFAVGLLIFASFAVTVAAEMLKKRRTLVREGTADYGKNFGDQFSGSKFGPDMQVTGDLAGRDIHHHHQLPFLRSVIVLFIVLWLAAASGLIAGATLKGGSTSPDVGGAPLVAVKTLDRICGTPWVTTRSPDEIAAVCPFPIRISAAGMIGRPWRTAGLHQARRWKSVFRASILHK